MSFEGMLHLNGILNVDKPGGVSSAAVVTRVKRALPRGTKIGHAGTLDPFATGVLLLLIGKATKLCETLMDQAKQYDATGMLGATTATDDPESPQVCWPHLSGGVWPNQSMIDEVLPRFVGKILQTPPIF